MMPILFKIDSSAGVDFFESRGLEVMTSEEEIFKALFRPESETDFNVVLVLNDCTRCFVTEERNGAFEMELDYPITGEHYNEIRLRDIIGVKSNPNSTMQLFRVNQITKPIRGIVTVYCQHISYDLSGYVVTPGWSASNPWAAMQWLKTHAVPECPFDMNAFEYGAGQVFSVTQPATIRSLLGGQQGSILDVYGGECSFDNYNVRIRAERGSDRGVVIAYGKNLTDLTQEENCSNVYTGVYPFWTNGDQLVQLDERYIKAQGDFGFERVMPLDLSNEWEEAPTDEQLRARASAYMTANKIGVPKVSLKLSFVQLENTEEYKGRGILERVDLCDTVHIRFEALGVNASAKCIKCVYNALLNRYESIELGDARSNLAAEIAHAEQAAKTAVTASAMKKAVNAATRAITGNLGGYVVMHDSNNDGEPDEILIMDTAEISTATKVWRWNNGGLGFSSNGYAGPFETAITQDGEIVADFITAGKLSASLINAGTITNESGNFSVDVTTGVIYSSDTRFNIGNYSELSGVSLVQRIRKNGAEFDAVHMGINANNTAGQLILYDGSTVVFAAGRTVGSGHEAGITVNGVDYAPMNVDYKDSRGENKTMRILCAGIY